MNGADVPGPVSGVTRLADVDIAWTRWRTAGRPRARIVAVHGWGSASTTWDRLLDALGHHPDPASGDTTPPPRPDPLAPDPHAVPPEPQGPPAGPSPFEVLTIDMRGHGRSAVASTPHTIAAMAADCAAVMAEVWPDRDVPVILLGHSMGGNVVVRLAEQPGVDAAAIVLLDPAMGATDRDVAELPGRLDALARQGSAAPASGAAGAFGPGASSELIDRARRTTEAVPAHVLIEGLLSTYVDADQIGLREQAELAARRSTVPVHRVYPSAVRAADDATWGWPQGRSWTLPGEGHFLHETSPAAIARIIETVADGLTA